MIDHHYLAMLRSYKRGDNCKFHMYVIRTRSYSFKCIRIESKVVWFCSFVKMCYAVSVKSIPNVFQFHAARDDVLISIKMNNIS
jgi:hypothetical protein